MSLSVALGGWAADPRILSPLCPAGVHYCDSTLIAAGLVERGTLVSDWTERVADTIQMVAKGQELTTLIGWSTGALLALGAMYHLRPRNLVLLAPTISFCRRESWRYGQRPLIVQSMRNQLQTDPHTVCSTFFDRCGIDSVGQTPYTAEQLALGLSFLELVHIEPVPSMQCKVVLMHGGNDQIIPLEAAHATGRLLGQTVAVFENQGHAFFVDTVIAKTIRETIERLEM